MLGAPQIRLDWLTYYETFKRAHGGNPILHDGRLLFQDGWRYSATDPAGPEFPPPLDIRHKAALVGAYWDIRLARVNEAIWLKERQIDALMQLSTAKSEPLQCIEVVLHEDEEGRAVNKSQSRPLKLQPLKDNLDELYRERDLCESNKDKANVDSQ